ncbi:MAG TPA: hypothetical protein VES70_20490 [Pseudomonas sp.]|nr:hypothetical protein [Pseudomonas sp.]
MMPFVARLARCLGLLSIAVAVLGVSFSLYVAVEPGHGTMLSSSHPAMWGVVMLWLVNLITMVLNAGVWLCGRRPRWLGWTLGIQLLMGVAVLFM